MYGKCEISPYWINEVWNENNFRMVSHSHNQVPFQRYLCQIIQTQREKNHYSLLLFTSWHEVSHIMWLSYSLIYSVTHSLHSDPLRNSITCTWIRNGNRIEWSSIWSVIMLVLTNRTTAQRGVLFINYFLWLYMLSPASHTTSGSVLKAILLSSMCTERQF